MARKRETLDTIIARRAAREDARSEATATAVAAMFRRAPLTLAGDAPIGGKEVMHLGSPAGVYTLHRDGRDFTIHHTLTGDLVTDTHIMGGDPEDSYLRIMATVAQHVATHRL